ncbi:MAG: RsmE family RNA methyltransferase [Bdellovibrio sp.]|nr:RsmE family RNA methyltransferase [Bdellovibrio sp.]
MNRVFLYPEEIVSLPKDREIAIHDHERTRHVYEILKAKAGENIKIVAINYGLGDAQIVHINETSLRLKIPPLPSASASSRSVELWVGACRPQTVKKIYEYAACMGVDSIRFFKAELSEKSYLTSKIFEPDHQRLHLALGLAQSGIYFHMPQVRVSSYFPTQPPNSPAYLCSLQGRQNLFTPALLSRQERVTLVFGPERGLTPAEESNFLQMGMFPVNIHPSTLRIEVAIISALSQLHARRFFLA